MNVIELISTAAVADVELAGLWWRIRKVKTSDIVDTGFAGLVAAHADIRKAQERMGGSPAEDAKDLTEEQLTRAAAGGRLRDLMRYQEALVCAGLTAVSADGKAWESMTCTLSGDTDKDKGILAVSELPPGVAQSLANEIMSLSTDQGRAVERLQGFRGAAGSAARPGRVG